MATRITRRRFLGAAAAATSLASRSIRAALPERPNILFILADDLGYGDLSCYGRPDYQTPVLDRLAREGIKFTSSYAAGPVCTPTRVAFVTGRYPQRLAVGLQEPLTRQSPVDVGLPPDHPTVASWLGERGYETALIGKWHLGWKPEFGPTRHGFNHFFGILSGAADYFTHRASDAAGTSGAREGSDLWEGVAPVERVGYLTDLLSDRAVDFVTRARAKPFYLSLHYTAPHSPWEGPEDRAVDHSTHGEGPMTAGGSLGIYAAMMKNMDAGIGRVLAALRRARLEQKTLVIFTSDNGGERYSYQWPFSFQKGYLWEGGIRVPAIVRWTGVVPAGRSTAQAAVTMDWTATIMAAAGAAPDADHPLEGVDLMPVCTGARAEYDRVLFWRTRNRDAARVGKWKYLQDSGSERLFDLSLDPGEKNDLGRTQPDVFKDIKRQFQEWNAGMLPRPTSS